MIKNQGTLSETEMEYLYKEGYFYMTYDDKYPIVIKRDPVLLHLCGYVGVPDDIILPVDAYTANVHGGITYDEKDLPNVLLPGIQRWIGFDCAHSGDWCAIAHTSFDNYRDMKYVLAECRRLKRGIEDMTPVTITWGEYRRMRDEIDKLTNDLDDIGSRIS